MNGSPLILLKQMRKNGPVRFSRCGVALLYLIKSMSMVPFSLWEYLFYRKKIEHHDLKHPPVFIIGHYRSGTTYLHKVMSRNKKWGGIITYNFLFPYHPRWLEKLIKPFLQRGINLFNLKNVHFNNYRLNLDDPLEEDMITIAAATPHSAFWGEIFPKHAEKQFNKQILFTDVNDKSAWQKTYLSLIKKLSIRNGGRQLLLKNPPNTGRIAALLELFPDAKFIFIYRNPYQVYFSTWRLWKETLEKNYALQMINDNERKRIIFYLYKNIMDKYLEERQLIAPGNLTEVKYEDFETDPLAEVERIYRELSLPGFNEAKPHIQTLLTKEKTYKKFSYEYPVEIQEEVYSQWHLFIDRWNYSKL